MLQGHLYWGRSECHLEKVDQNKLLPDGTFITPKLDDLFPFLSKKILNEERLKAKKIKNG